MANYTKAELLTEVAERAGVSKTEVESVIDALFSTVTAQAKAGNKVSWPGFGSFSISHRAARTGRNPQTGAEIQIPATSALKFTPAKALKDQLNDS